MKFIKDSIEKIGKQCVLRRSRRDMVHSFFKLVYNLVRYFRKGINSETIENKDYMRKYFYDHVYNEEDCVLVNEDSSVSFYRDLPDARMQFLKKDQKGVK
ncbi:hypothetical protein LI951_14055 [Enterococcus sp. BWT-B8]|uniref:hypothetical protein n=1 Tax=Enterococcus sp. BWT-B8 TaxID=2885157 RepID=UPI001E51FFF4|nr:hypothetical protein [Enterococcus sp. BWT-B8]MCB5953196.1 hypothetical protein [Enterococcus sp. BWT-B8]